MKIIFCIFFAILFPNLAMAQLNPYEARWDVAKEVGGCGAGIISSIVVHEIGHEITSEMLNTDLKWNGLKWNSYSSNRSKMRKISISGLGAQMLSSEVILRSNMISKDNSFFLCWVGYNIFRQITYPLQYEFSNAKLNNSASYKGHNDLVTYEKNGGNVKYLGIGLILHALWTGYRVYHNPKTPIFFSLMRNEVKVGLDIDF